MSEPSHTDPIYDQFIQGLEKELERATQPGRLDRDDLRDWLTQGGVHVETSIDEFSRTADGHWERGCGHDDHASLRIEDSGDDFRVIFFTQGDCGAWELDRRASFDRGLFVLNRPVREYSPGHYDRLYAATVGEDLYLISQSCLRRYVGNPPGLQLPPHRIRPTSLQSYVARRAFRKTKRNIQPARILAIDSTRSV